MVIGNRVYDTENHTYVMGILNVTPDSFSDGGRFGTVDRALYHAQEMIGEGADLLDIGGESIRPGCSQVSAEEEMERVLPVLEQVKAEFDIPVSVDTYKPEVAAAAAAAGADMINDVWGLKYDEAMADVIARYQLPCCLMHNRREAVYYNYMKDLLNDLQESVAIALRHGIRRGQIILDPGIGFGKTYEHSLEALHRLERLKELGFPVLLGASRKSVIGLTLDVPVEERLEGTLAATVAAVMKGCSFVRVHDVRANKRAVRMAEAIGAGRRVEEKTWTELR